MACEHTGQIVHLESGMYPTEDAVLVKLLREILETPEGACILCHAKGIMADLVEAEEYEGEYL